MTGNGWVTVAAARGPRLTGTSGADIRVRDALSAFAMLTGLPAPGKIALVSHC